MIRAYKLGKQGEANVSMVLVPDTTPKAFSKKFSFRSMAGDLFEAIGFKAKTKEEAPVSPKLVKQKKRPRLFDSVDLGSIDEVEKKLKDQK